MHDDLQNGIDRVLLASYQPDKARAISSLADRLIRALATLEVREGVLIAQLDELVLGQDVVLANVPFLPPEPAALCLTGTPRLVAAVRSSLQKGTTGRFADVRPAAHLKGLRVAALLRDGTVTLDVRRELGVKGPGVSPRRAGRSARRAAISSVTPTRRCSRRRPRWATCRGWSSSLTSFPPSRSGGRHLGPAPSLPGTP